jgi:bifunctional pyridoxal-dependent enzyme with beta-cystathionase and maltose regulon repressor activities
MKKEQLNQVVEIASVLFQAAHSKLAQAVKRESDLREILVKLEQSRRDRVNANLLESDIALVAGADLRWQAWVDLRRSSINQELAKCLATQEKLREVAGRAFGKEQSAIKVRQNYLLEVKRLQVRKSDYPS